MGNGVILHYEGSGWVRVNSPTTKSLASVAMDSATDGWAVGNNGTIVHYTGSNTVSRHSVVVCLPVRRRARRKCRTRFYNCMTRRRING
jgi:hypothetical protein